MTLGLAAVLVVIAVAGIFDTMLLSTRERVRDVAVLKAIGMTPAQVLAMSVLPAWWAARTPVVQVLRSE